MLSEPFLRIKCVLYLETSPSFRNISATVCHINRIPKEEKTRVGRDTGGLRLEMKLREQIIVQLLFQRK